MICRLLVAVALIATAMFQTSSVSAQETVLNAPPVGTRLSWRCDGPYSRSYDLQVTRIKDMVVTYAGRVDRKKYFVSKHAWLTGTSLWYRLVGRRKQWFDLEDFADYRFLRPGSRFKGAVPAITGKEKWVWKHDIAVGQARDINHRVLGRIRVIPVSEKRSIYHGKYSSTMTTLLWPDRGISVSWSYKDHRGTENCQLAAIKFP